MKVGWVSSLDLDVRDLRAHAYLWPTLRVDQTIARLEAQRRSVNVSLARARAQRDEIIAQQKGRSL